MATITVGGSGNWDSVTPNAPWPGGTLPTAADDVVINNAAHVLTQNSMTAVCRTLTITLGEFNLSQSSSSKLVVEQGITQGTSASAKLMLNMSAAAAYVSEVLINNVGATGAGYIINVLSEYDLIGAVRKRVTRTQAALVANTTKSVVVDDATGWLVGDMLVFGTTQAYNATPRVDIVTIDTLTPGSGTTATITWVDGAGTAGAVLYDHADRCYAGNLTSNLIIGPAVAGNVATVKVNAGSRPSAAKITDVLFRSATPSSTFGQVGVLAVDAANSGTNEISNNVFYDWRSTAAIWYRANTSKYVRDSNVFYSAHATAYIHGGQNISYELGPETNMAVFRCQDGPTSQAPGSPFIDPLISGCSRYAVTNTGYDATIEGGGIWSCGAALRVPATTMGPMKAISTALGTTFSGAVNGGITSHSGPASVIIDSCPLDITGESLFSTLDITFVAETSYVQYLNRNNDPSVQEIYRNISKTNPVFVRDASTTNRSTSAMRVDITGTANREFTREFNVLSKSGQAINIVGYMRKNSTYGSSTRPSVTISGLGITPVVATMTDVADTWEKFDISATQNSGSDGLLTVTFTAQSANNGGKAWLSGVPFAPFVTRARHYGYLFDETSPTRTVDPLVDDDEATAAALTGMAFDWDATQTDTTISDDVTFQELYDHHQSQAVLNVGDAAALTGAGVAGSPTLFAQGDIDVETGEVLNGAGSLSMGAHVLTAELNGGAPYTYTGGTYSRLTTADTFNGGQLNIGAHGAYVFSLSSAILSMTPTAAETYVLGDATFSGTIDLRNTSGTYAITVELPAGTTYTTDNNTGETITVETPQVYQSVTVAAAVAGSGLELYDVENDEQLYNDIPGSWPYTWTDSNPASVNREIRMRLTYESNTGTAKQMLEEIIGTCGTTEGTKAISRTVTQQDDLVYIAHCAALGITGEDVTDIEIDDTLDRVKFDFAAGGDYDARRIYIYMVYWLHTNVGREDDFVFCDPLDAANLPMEGVLFENVSDPKITITFINAYVYDKDTGRAKDLIYGDGINFAPDHVVNNIVTVGGANIITGDIDDVAAKVQTGLTAQGLTPTRAAKLDNLDVATGTLLLSDDYAEPPSAIENAAAVLAAATSAPIAANMVKTNGTALKGDGTEGDKFRSVLAA